MKLVLNNLFGLEILSVNAPRFVDYGGVSGYEVSVVYKNFEKKEKFFSTEEECLYTLWNGPEDAANHLFNAYKKKMKIQQNDCQR